MGELKRQMVVYDLRESYDKEWALKDEYERRGYYAGKEEGIEEGKQQGIDEEKIKSEQEKLEIAKKLLQNDVPIDIVIASTQLSKEQILQIKDE